jgi:hypothetical protein
MHNQQGFDFAEEKIIYKEKLYAVSPNELNEILHRSIGALSFLNKNLQNGAGTGVLIS